MEFWKKDISDIEFNAVELRIKILAI